MQATALLCRAAAMRQLCPGASPASLGSGAYLRWTVAQWKRVLFDESTFQIVFDKNTH